MRLNRLETHDRYEHFIKDQAQNIWEGANDCLTKNTDSLALQDHSPYIYIFAHPRTADDGVTKRMLWQPRLSKPKAQTNSYLFRAMSKSDVVEICWLIPPKEMWKQYEKGQVCESNWVLWSINQFKANKAELEKPFADDWTEEQIQNIWKRIVRSRRVNGVVSSLLSTK